MDAIEIHPPDPSWPAQFAAEQQRLLEALHDEAVLAIEHFGSTAIPGIAAKPVIDMLMAVPSLTQARARLVPKLAPLGYLYWAEDPSADRLFFVKGLPPLGQRRSHHLHVVERPSARWDQLRFRDYLRTHPDEAARYEALKRDAAETHRNDREAYTEAKSAYVACIMRLAASD